jgi:SAM-dependent methyltransferase
MNQKAKLWGSGEAYDAYVGRWSRLVAPLFVEWVSPSPERDWVDVGCGTGELTDAIIRSGAPRSVFGIDPSESHITFAKDRFSHDGRTRFETAGAQQLPTADASADYVVSGLVLNFVPEPTAALAEAYRVTRRGGTVAAYVWDYAGEMQMIRGFWDAAIELDVGAREFDEGKKPFSICREGPLADLFTRAGLQDVATRAIDVPTVFTGFDDYWTPFLAGQAPAPRYAMSLSEERRAELRDLIKQRLPIGADGSISLIARAWAVKGVR